MEVKIHVKNMTCHNCSKILRKALTPIGGITSVVIKKPQRNMFIEFDPAKINLSQIVDIITQKGYSAEIQRAIIAPKT